MNAKSKILMSLASAAAATQAARMFSNLNTHAMLGWMGLARRRSHRLENLGLISSGALAGAFAALLFAPAAGRDTRHRMGNQVSRFGKEAGHRLREAADHLPLPNKLKRQRASTSIDIERPS